MALEGKEPIQGPLIDGKAEGAAIIGGILPFPDDSLILLLRSRVWNDHGLDLGDYVLESTQEVGLAVPRIAEEDDVLFPLEPFSERVFEPGRYVDRLDLLVGEAISVAGVLVVEPGEKVNRYGHAAIPPV